MGVEYKHYLIPRTNELRPSAEQLARFAALLVENRWVCDPSSMAFRNMTFDVMSHYAHAKRTGALAWTFGKRRKTSTFPVPAGEEWWQERVEADVMVIWPVKALAAAQVQYPFEENETDPEETYFEFQVHLGHDYIYHSSEVIDPFSSTLCECGEDAEYDVRSDDPFFSSRLRLHCPRCERRFDVSQRRAAVRDGWTGAEREVAGGTTYRFAVVIDCGKCVPTREKAPVLRPELRSLCTAVFGCAFYDLHDIY